MANNNAKISIGDDWPKPTKWGEIENLAGGKWRTTWEFELEEIEITRLDEVALKASHPEAGFFVTLQSIGDSRLIAIIDTNRWAMEVDYYGFTFQLFKSIDRSVGRIRLIQGFPRDWYSPFMRK